MEVSFEHFVRTVYPDLNPDIALGIYHLAMGRKIEWHGQDVNLQGAGNSKVLARLLGEKTGKPFLDDDVANKLLLDTKLFALVENEMGPAGWLVMSKKPTDPSIIPDPGKDWTHPPAGFLLPGPDGQTYRNPWRTEQEVTAWKSQRSKFQESKQQIFAKHRAKGGYTPDQFFDSPRPSKQALADLAARATSAGAAIEDYVNVQEAVKGAYPFTG